MKEIENSIVPFVESQFPAFYRDEGENFIAFVKAYYEWMEQEGNVLYHTRRLYDYIDVDTTITDFLNNFQSKYLSNFPASNLLTPRYSANNNPNIDDTNKRVLTKKAVDLYRSKGNENALNLLFRLLYQQPVDVFLPSADILKPSDGRWIVASYIELTITEKNKEMIGQTIKGLTSGATAIVEKISRRMMSGNIFDVAYLTNIQGSFLFNEIVTHDGLAVGSPTTLGSVTRLVIDNQGSGFEVGQTVDLISQLSGRQAKARVTKTGSQTGKITYSNPPTDGGYGYTMDSEVFISSNVMIYDNKVFNDAGYDNFVQFETVSQPMANVPFTASTNAFANGVLVYGIDASGASNTTVAGGVVLKLSQNTSTNTGWLLVSNRRISNVSIGSIQNATNTGSFSVGEKVYQIDPDTSANSAVGYVLDATSLRVSIDIITGTFSTNRNVVGSTSNCYANAISLQTYNEPFTNDSITHIITPSYGIISLLDGSVTDKTATAKVVGANTNAVGIYDVDGANPFVNSYGNYIIGSISGVAANVGIISLGDPGGFDIGSLTDTETVFISTDFISDNNIFDEAYLTLDLDAEAYGFPKFPSGNSETIIEQCLGRDTLEIGSIASLTNIDPGSNNTATPFIRIYERPIAMHDRRNFSLVLANTSKPFVIGEQIVQSFPDGAVTLTLTTVTGTFDSTGRELIKQVRSDGETVYGELVEKNISGGAGTIRVRVANTSNTFDTSNTVYGIESEATATVTAATQNNYFTLTKGSVLSSNLTSMDVKRRSFSASFIRGIPVTGSTSGATANVIAVYPIDGSPVIGNNAIVTAVAGVQSGTLQEAEITDSGIGYYNLEPVEIKHPNNNVIATGYVVMENEGKTGGFYRDTGGFISADKKVQDSNYYQEFSYEVQSGISLDKYATILKETLQVAGTKLFGKVIKSSNVDITLNTYDSTRGVKLTVTGNTQNSFVVGENISHEGNTASGILSNYTTTLVLDGSNNEFVVGLPIARPTFQSNLAQGIIQSVEYNIVANTTTIQVANISGIFTSTANVETRFNRKFVEYQSVEGTLTDGEIVYQSNGTANVGVGDLVSSAASRLVIKPLTDIIVNDIRGTLTSGDDVFQRIDGTTNSATGILFSSNSTHVLVGNTRGEFLPGYRMLTATGNAYVARLGGKLDNFTVTDKVYLTIDTLSSAGFEEGEIVYQASSEASGTIVTSNTTQLLVANVTGTFVSDSTIAGNTSNTTANVSLVTGPFLIVGVDSGAMAKSVTIETPYTNVSLGVINTINNLTLTNVEGSFVISTVVSGNTSDAIANVTNVEVLLY